ncbi:MAG: sugar ABC transporter permease [Jatrophihabitans endophyticus]|nr:sugar ABC transporter permease [Jatrophihabitans endophyticus]
MALLGLFVFVPLVDAVVISFQRTTGFGGARFIGFANYGTLFTDPVFWRATGNTVLFTAIVTPLSMAVGLGLAALVNSALPARGLFRSILIIPMAVSGVATATLGGLVFDQNFGLLDELLRSVGLPAVTWQSGSVPAFVSIVVVTLWWRVGINMLVYLAGLQGLDEQLREAAMLDGAGPVQRFRYVVLPALRPTSFFLVIMNVIYSFQAFDIIYVLTGGGPRNATSLLVTYAYDTGFVTRDQGYAAAIGMVLLLFTAAFTALRWQLGRGRDA